MLRRRRTGWSESDTGSVLLIVAASLVLLLAISAFAIDLANFYLARAQAQRAADAAALAGATAFVNSGCTAAGCSAGGPQETLAMQQAEAVAAQNYIAGKPAIIQNGDMSFTYPTPQEPQITVTAGRAVPTFFAKIFGIKAVNVSAKATAEAYNPSGGDTSVGVACLKPFLVPNCDPVHTSPANPQCATSGQGYFFDPGTGQVEHPGSYSQGGIIGMPWALHSEAAPSQWYLVGFNGAPPSSASALRNHIVECTSAILTCGTTLTTANGKKVGPVTQGVEDLIDAGGTGLDQGQDSINTNVGPPFAILGGSNNPTPDLRGKTFYNYGESPSVVTVPVYAGNALTPGGSNVQIVGYLQVFIQDVIHKGNDNEVDMVILNASYCGGSPGTGSGGSSNSTVVGNAGSPIPIRLIRTD